MTEEKEGEEQEETNLNLIPDMKGMQPVQEIESAAYETCEISFEASTDICVESVIYHYYTNLEFFIRQDKKFDDSAGNNLYAPKLT